MIGCQPESTTYRGGHVKYNIAKCFTLRFSALQRIINATENALGVDLVIGRQELERL